MSDEQPSSKSRRCVSRHRRTALRRIYRCVFKVSNPVPILRSKTLLQKEKNRQGKSDFNPEEHFTRIKEWRENHSAQDRQLTWPENCFEHLVIVGLPHTSNIEGITASIKKEQARSNSRSDLTATSVQSEKPNHTPPKPSFPPELLYQFPEDKPLHMKPDELVSFCFPHGVIPKLLTRTSSMSALNDVIYGQQHFVNSDQSFVFLQKGGDDLPMFGVCYLVNQMLHTPPGLVKHKFKATGVSPSKYMVAAPRCYCLLSRYPFFELHFQVLNLVLGLERLDSISDFMNEIVKLPPDSSLFNCLDSKNSHLRALTPDPCCIRAFSASPTPPSVFQAIAAQAAAESDVSSQTQIAASDIESHQACIDSPLRTRDSFSSHFPITDVGSSSSSANRVPRDTHCRSISGQSLRECEISDSSVCPYLGVADSAYLSSDFRPYSTTPPASSHRYTESADSEFLIANSASMPDLSPLQNGLLFDDIYRSPSLAEMLPDHRLSSVSWTENPKDIMPACQKLLCHFRSLKVPEPGEKIVFIPEEASLQKIEYTRPNVSREWNRPSSMSGIWTERSLIEEETARGLRSWTVMTLCRSLSLDNILSLIAGAMLERQIVFFCSNIGVLTSAVLSLIPLLRPFAWQSLILPALPTCLLEFLEAPVPFAVGIQHKTPEIAHRCTDLIRVNLYKDKIKNAPLGHMLPSYKSLYADLLPWHKRLQDCSRFSRRPTHVVTSAEYHAVEAFLKVLHSYLSGLLEDLERHTIKDVGSDNVVSLLLEESLIESFPPKDQPFMKAFSQTQMFSSFVDSVIGN